MQTHDACFDVSAELLKSFSETHIVRKRDIVRDILQTNNTSVILKFCDVCKYLNIDPMHKEALPLMVIFMCKSKHCSDMARIYLENSNCEELLRRSASCTDEDRG